MISHPMHGMDDFSSIDWDTQPARWMIMALWSDKAYQWNVWGGPQERWWASASWSDDKCVTMGNGYIIPAPYRGYTADTRWMITASCYEWIVNVEIGWMIAAPQNEVDDRGLVLWIISQPMHGVDDHDPIARYTTSKVDDYGLGVWLKL